MKWFIMVLMMGTFEDGTRDTFLYMEPEFNTVEQCETYVYRQAPEIKRHMMIEFQGKPIDTVYCMREDKIKDIVESTLGTSI